MSHALRIGLRMGSADPFWVQVREAIEQQAHQLAVSLIPIDPERPLAQLSAQEQQDLLEELLVQDVGALICAYLPDELAYRILAAGLPVIHLTESAVRHPRFVSPRWYYHTAQLVGGYLVEQLAGRGHVLAVGGLLAQQGEDGRSRLDGICDALRPHPQLQLSHIPSVWRYERAYPQIEAALQQFDRPFDAIFGLSDSLALAARAACQANGLLAPHTLTVGINGDPQALAAIADGRMAATVEISAASFGHQAVFLACQASRGQPLPTHFSSQPYLVTAQNVADLAMQKLIAIADLPSRLVGVNRQREQQRLTQLETSLAINHQIGTMLDPHELSHAIADLIRTNYHYDHVQTLLWREREQELVCQPDPATGGRVRIPLAQAGLLAQALLRNELLFIPDTQRSVRYPPDPAWPELRSRVVVPIRLGTATLGLLDLHGSRPALHTRQELVSLQLLADQLGVALRNAELYSAAVEARLVAEQADRLKSRLLANVSHELRTPLNVILGYSQAALDSPGPYGVALPPALLHDLQHIYRSGEHLSRLINDLLDRSRAEVGALELFPEPVATGAFLADVFGSVASHGGSGQLEWRLELPERLPIIQADPLRLRQVLLNLLHNAQKFTAAGTVVLGAELTPPHLHLWVRDSGAGIPIDQQERIFEPFVTGEHADRRRQGLGLGLCIARQLVALHGGSITLESQPGQGSTFHIYLPLPALAGPPVGLPTPTPLVLALISACEQPTPAILELSRRRGLPIQQLRTEADLAALLATAQPAMLAWDLAHATAEDWALIQRLRGTPQLCQLPFLLYDQAGPGLINVLVKPLGGRTLLETIDALAPSRTAGPILIVDDDPQARELYVGLAATALPGQAICTADGGSAALELLQRQVPCLVILDLMMPDIDGFSVLAALRQDPRTAHVPVLVISGHMLSRADVARLDHQSVTFHSKDTLSPEETAASMLRAQRGNARLPQQTSALVKQALAFIHQHHTRAFSRQELAAALGVSKNYLTHIFHQELGLSPWEYLNRYRIRHAKELLRTSTVSITAVASQVGFDDAAYFSRIFRREVGASPREYRAAAGR